MRNLSVVSAYLCQLAACFREHADKPAAGADGIVLSAEALVIPTTTLLMSALPSPLDRLVGLRRGVDFARRRFAWREFAKRPCLMAAELGNYPS